MLGSVHCHPQRKGAHHDKAPRLHETDRWNLVRRSEQSVQGRIVQKLWEVADTYMATLHVARDRLRLSRRPAEARCESASPCFRPPGPLVLFVSQTGIDSGLELK